jgi:hypothetical protein
LIDPSDSHFSAEESMTSVMQLVFSCALRATFPYALRYSVALAESFWTSWTSSSMGLLMMSRSRTLKGPWYDVSLSMRFVRCLCLNSLLSISERCLLSCDQGYFSSGDLR